MNKALSCECKCKFDERKCNSNQWWSIDKCRCECKKHKYVKEIIFGILVHVFLKIVNIYQIYR